MYLLAVLGSQGIVVKYTAAIYFRKVHHNIWQLQNYYDRDQNNSANYTWLPEM